MKKCLFSLILLTAVLSGCETTNPVLEVEGGQIQGVETSIKGIYVYKGIPFAAPPVGDLRWKDPQPVIPWEGVKVADTFSAGAYQALHDSSNPWTSEFYMNDPEYSEDCLYLNVFTSAPGQTDKKLPVAMWIHGGGYTGGWSWEPEFDGKIWAQKGVVLVTINYRLGVFGFMQHPLLSEESGRGKSGNYGILDQIAALKWVYNNIAQFGGDPENITIFGQSAGAGSVKTLVSSPLTGNMIKKAIIQSGGGVSERALSPTPAAENRPANMPAMKTAEESWKEIMDWGGYDTLEKMRAASTEDIFTLSTRYAAETGARTRAATSPYSDGYVTSESFDYAAVGGRIKDIPYMIGFTLDDMGTPGTGVNTFCDLRNKAGKPVYAYEFIRPLPDDAAGSHDMKGAFHSSELWFVFKSLEHSDRPFTKGDWDLAERIITHWTNFAKTGDPGNGWEAYTAEKPEYMLFNVNADETADGSKMGKPFTRNDIK